MCPDCGKHYDIGDWPFACAGLGHTPGPFWTHDAQLHESEKVVVYENRYTGDVKIPGRSDRPLHPKLAAEGYVRKTLDTPAQIRQLEQKNKVLHERSHYNLNSVQAEKDTGSS